MLGDLLFKRKSAPPLPADKIATQDAIFQREVEEELRQDQLKRLWDAYGTYLIAGIGAFIVGIFVVQQVQASRLAAAQAAGAKYDDAVRAAEGKPPAEAAAAFDDVARTGPTGYATLARLQKAAKLAAADKTAEAVAAYDGVASATDADGLLRDIARLQAAALRLDAADWTEMENRLTPLIDERNALRAIAREYLGLAASHANRREDARKLFLQVLGDAKASKAIKDRAGGYLATIIAATLAKPSEPPGAAPAPAPNAAPTAAAPTAATK